MRKNSSKVEYLYTKVGYLSELVAFMVKNFNYVRKLVLKGIGEFITRIVSQYENFFFHSFGNVLFILENIDDIYMHVLYIDTEDRYLYR